MTIECSTNYIVNIMACDIDTLVEKCINDTLASFNDSVDDSGECLMCHPGTFLYLKQLMSQVCHKMAQFVTLDQFKLWLNTLGDVERLPIQSYISILEGANWCPFVIDKDLPHITEASTMEEKLTHIKFRYVAEILYELVSPATDVLVENGYRVLYPWDINIQYDYKKTFDLIDADVDNIRRTR